MAITDELKKKDGSTVQPGAPRPNKGLFPYNRPEVDIYANAGAQPAAPKVPGPGLFPYNRPEANIYGGLGKPASAPENQPGARGILGNAPMPPKPLGNPNQIPAGRGTPTPMLPASAPANPNQIPTNSNPAAPAVPSVAPQSTQPMDAQALADRATAQSMMSGFGDMNRRAGAAIADVATLIPRGLAGAYDTAVVRPMRAAGMNAGFLSPMLAPDGADPASQTPFYDKIRAQDAMAAAPKPVAAPGAPVTENAVVRNAMAAGASANPAAPVQANPNVAPSVAPGAPGAQAPNAMQAMTAPSGAVTRVGNSYSGTNVAGDISINGQGPRGGVITAQDNQAAENLARRGGQSSGFGPSGAMRGSGQVSSMDTSAGYAADLKQLAKGGSGNSQYDQEVQAAKETNAWQARQTLERAALGTPSFMGRKGTAPSRAAQRVLAGQIEQETTKRGQDITAANQTASQKLADQRFGLDSAKAGQDATNAGIENEAKNLTLNAQKAFLNAKTPEERQAAQALLAGLSGKERTQQAQYAYAPGGQMVDPVTGQTVTQPGVIFNQFTGEPVQPRQQAGGQKAAPPNTAVQMLKDNPTMAAQFDAKYGPGASKQYLAQK